MFDDLDLAAKRQTATWARTVAWLRHTQPEMSDDEMDRIALQKVDEGVYGFDAKKDRHGAFIQQGIGSPGHETVNHFASIRRYRGEDEWRKAVAEIYKRDPEHAKRLNLPKPSVA